jgi:hypothetical protein
MSKQIDRVYFDSCIFINLVKYRASRSCDNDEIRGVWWAQKLLEASRNNDVRVITSTLSVAECTHVRDGAVPSEDVKRFFDGLLCSGKAGVYLTQSTYSIIERARNLRWIDEVCLGGVDSVHIASAIERGCSEFLTDDSKILKNSGKINDFGMRVCHPYDTRLLPSSYNQMGLHEQSVTADPSS